MDDTLVRPATPDPRGFSGLIQPRPLNLLPSNPVIPSEARDIGSSRQMPELQHHMTDFSKLLIVLGLILLVAGLFLALLGRAHFPLGRLPGDILYRGKRATIYFPLATCILISVVLSLVLYAIGKWKR